MKIKLIDLANELNISVAAVSMALNNKKGVSDETRDKVLELAKEKGYKVKELPIDTSRDLEVKKYIKLLRIQKHGLVAVDTAFFSRVIEGIEDECKKNNYELLVSNCKLDNIDGEWINSEIANTIEGMIILATELELADADIFDQIKKPFVMLDSYFPGKEWDYILMNNYNAVYQAIKYLDECGHKSIGYLKSNTTIYNFDERFRSYKDILNHFGIDYVEKDIIPLEPTLSGAYDEMNRLLSEGQINHFPTAFLADNDIIAVGAMNAMKDNGIKIPEDVSIIGIDDMPFAQVISPKLTTSKVYKKDIGRESVKLILRRIENFNGPTQKREVNTSLVLRNSVKIM